LTGAVFMRARWGEILGYFFEAEVGDIFNDAINQLDLMAVRFEIAPVMARLIGAQTAVHAPARCMHALAHHPHAARSRGLQEESS